MCVQKFPDANDFLVAADAHVLQPNACAKRTAPELVEKSLLPLQNFSNRTFWAEMVQSGN